MTTTTTTNDWQETLDKIRSGEERIETYLNKNGVDLPSISRGLGLYELLQLLGATTAGYNHLLDVIQRKDKQLREKDRLVNARFKQAKGGK